ncbi:MAG TPA: hypothetical protein VLW50_08905 [Streptosporangiaceae bacterium]|nr:hypothetical protein [Streptosporangiaceae bacterium]
MAASLGSRTRVVFNIANEPFSSSDLVGARGALASGGLPDLADEEVMRGAWRRQ